MCPIIALLRIKIAFCLQEVMLLATTSRNQILWQPITARIITQKIIVNDRFFRLQNPQLDSAQSHPTPCNSGIPNQMICISNPLTDQTTTCQLKTKRRPERIKRNHPHQKLKPRATSKKSFRQLTYKLKTCTSHSERMLPFMEIIADN
jgi:hypothetical protein